MQQQQNTNVDATPFKKAAKRNGKSPSPVGKTTAAKNALLAYNQYGEIVRMKDMLKPKDPSLLTIVDCLRLLEKVYGYDVSSVLDPHFNSPGRCDWRMLEHRCKY